MPEEEIQKIQESRKKTEQNIDLDELLLELAIEKKKDLEAAYKKLGKTINPLVLIQLPNKDKESEDRNEETKEHFVRRFLAEQGVESYRVATWLSGHQENLVEITNNHSHIDYLLFKEAPATGWDCPRASILVMYRDIKKDSFRTQIIGRILRMPEAQHYSDPQLNAGYIYTNYQRAEIKDIPDTAKNQVKTQFSTIRPYLQNITLSSVFFNRASYNDLGADFQAVFISVANEFFGLSGDLTESIHQNAREKLIKKGLDFELFEKLQIAMIVNAKISDFDYFNRELKTKGEQKNYELSGNDLQRLFDLLCYRAIGDQQEESRKYNVSRSWEPLKRAIRVWLGYTVPSDQKIWYKIVCNDLLKEDSVLKRIIGDALEKYRLVHAKKVEGKKSKDKTEFEWTVPTSRAFGQDFQEMMPQPRLSALNPFFVQSEYRGKQNEEKFIEFLEEQGDKIEWWYKNGDQGREHFAVSYTDSQTASEEAFYVDWIIKFKTGDLIGLYDTKGGITAKEGEGKDKAEWLQKYIAKFNDASQKLMGGIVIDSAGWKVQNNKQYQYNLLNLGQAGWKNLEL